MNWEATKEVKKETRISRRDFLKILTGVSATGLAGLAIKEIVFEKDSGDATERVIENNERWKIITHGAVEQKTIDLIKLSIESVFSELQYKPDKKNLDLHIYAGRLYFQDSNEKSVAWLEPIFDENKAIIRISIDGVQSVFAKQKSGVSVEIVLSVIAAHEAVHFVQFQRGENMPEVHSPDLQTRKKLATHPLELEANTVSGKVAGKLFNITLDVKE